MPSPKSAAASTLTPPDVNYKSAGVDLLSNPLAPAGTAAVQPIATVAVPTSAAAGVPAAAATALATTSGSPASTPVVAVSVQTNGQGSGNKSLLPAPVQITPTQIERGTASWTQQRVDDLISAGTIQADWLPDIRATALTHLQIQNSQKREMLRFSNAIANTGANNWQVRRGLPISDPDQIAYALSLGLDPSQLAVTGQELLNAQGQIAAVITDAALSEFHPEHKHFHIGETAEFGVERFNAASGSWDPITGLEVVKTTFCLIDVNQIKQLPGADPDHYEVIKSPANANVYNDCYADVQGIQDGWIDRYNHSLPGQEVDITGMEAGTYRIISTVNPAGWFMESDFSNNVSWTAFDLSRDSNGNAKLRTIPGATGGIWFDNSSNGMG